MPQQPRLKPIPDVEWLDPLDAIIYYRGKLYRLQKQGPEERDRWFLYDNNRHGHPLVMSDGSQMEDGQLLIVWLVENR